MIRKRTAESKGEQTLSKIENSGMCRSGRTTKVDPPVVARSASDPAMVKEESHNRKSNANRCQKGLNYSNSLLGFSEGDWIAVR
jgi:hypothetical protein